MTPTNFSFKVKSSGKPLDLEVKLDNIIIHDLTIDSGITPVTIELDDDVEADHCLEIILKNKTPEHTTVDENNNIVEDSELVFSDIMVDEIDIQKLLHFQTKYSHNFNGSGELTEENFYGTIGCNGTVEINLQTPIYLWLLENL